MNNLYHSILLIAFLTPIEVQAQMDTIILDDAACHDKALQCNYDIRRQQNIQEAATYQRKEMLAEFFPSATASGGIMYSPQTDLMSMQVVQTSISLKMQLRGAYMANVHVTQPILAGGQIANNYRLTKVGEKVSVEQVRLAKAQAIAEVGNAYWTYVAVRSKLHMLEEYRIQLDTLLSNVTSSVQVGLATDADVLKVRTAQCQVEYAYMQAQSGMELCRMALSNMLDIPYDSIYLLPAHSDIQLTENKTNSSSVLDRPEWQLLQYQVNAKHLLTKTTIGKYLPSIGLAASYNWLGNIHLFGNTPSQYGNISVDMTIRTNTPIVMGVLTIPITDWGKGAYAIKRAKLDETNARLELEKNAHLMTLEMQQARMNLLNGWELVRSAEVALQSATVALRVMRDRYDVGMCSLSDLLSSQSDWQKAESDYIEARTQYRINEIEYLRSTGQLK